MFNVQKTLSFYPRNVSHYKDPWFISFCPPKIFNHLELDFLSLSLSLSLSFLFPKTLQNYSSYLNFQTPHYLISNTFIYSSFNRFLHITMADKGNASIPFMLDDEDMQQNFENFCYRRPIARGGSFNLENLTSLPKVHDVFRY